MGGGGSGSERADRSSEQGAFTPNNGTRSKSGRQKYCRRLEQMLAHPICSCNMNALLDPVVTLSKLYLSEDV